MNKESADVLNHQLLQRLDISAVVAWFINWSFRDERGMGKPQIIQ
jgi:hypothetical protein